MPIKKSQSKNMDLTRIVILINLRTYFEMLFSFNLTEQTPIFVIELYEKCNGL